MDTFSLGSGTTCSRLPPPETSVGVVPPSKALPAAELRVSERTRFLVGFPCTCCCWILSWLPVSTISSHGIDLFKPIIVFSIPCVLEKRCVFCLPLIWPHQRCLWFPGMYFSVYFCFRCYLRVAHLSRFWKSNLLKFISLNISYGYLIYCAYQSIWNYFYCLILWFIWLSLHSFFCIRLDFFFYCLFSFWKLHALLFFLVIVHSLWKIKIDPHSGPSREVLLFPVCKQRNGV